MAFARKMLGAVVQVLMRRHLIDSKFYYDRYPDVAESGLAAEAHYHAHGWREGRNPSPNFHSLYYAARHLPDGKLTENPLAHYVSHGGALSGLDTFPNASGDWIALQKFLVANYFDEVFYRRQYGSRLGAHDPIDHYFAVGWSTGCNPSDNFDTRTHLAQNAHILGTGVNPLLHFALLTGARSEGAKTTKTPKSPFESFGLTLRSKHNAQPPALRDSQLRQQSTAQADMISDISGDFDVDFYKSQYKDVANAGVDPITHYVEYGWREGRNPSPLFHTRYYQALYGKEFGPDANPFHHYVTFGRDKGYRANPIGSGRWPRPTAPADAAWRRVAAANDPHAEVNVIVPVYRGYDETLATIYSVLSQPQKTRFRLTVINDCSPEPHLTEKLRELADHSLFTYAENSENLGFIGTINKGLGVQPDLDVILLNADTLVFGDWIDRILAHARADDRIATITPYSNNATICSYPDINSENTVALECSLEQLDAYAAVCNKNRRTPAPTGVGFCLFIRRAVIAEIGEFDAAFGRGYGEENDFCMRAIKAGYTNILAEDVLVYHSGRVSFLEHFDEEYGAGQTLLLSKHPDYPRRVAEYVRSDPGRIGRVRLDLYRLARNMGDRVAMFVTMNGSGGVLTHVNNMARRLEAAGVAVLFAYIDGDRASFQPFDRKREIYAPSVLPVDLRFDDTLVAEFIDWTRPTFIHLHSLAMASWRASEMMMQLCSRYGDRLYVTLHDYDPLCFRHNLVDAEGRFCGKPDNRICIPCAQAATTQNRGDPNTRSAVWRAFLSDARRVFVPSADTQERFAQAFPEIDFVVREHEEDLDELSTLAPPDRTEPLRLVSIGAIGPHKGSNLIYALALDARNRMLPIEYHIVGHTAIDAEMTQVGVFLHGRYFSTSEVIKHLQKIRPSYALFLSIWPETYCYTLSLALALGTPPIVFDLGAQAARTRHAGFGVVLDPALLGNPQAINDAILGLSVAEEWAKVRPISFRKYDRFPFDYYDLPDHGADATADRVPAAVGALA